MRKILVLGLLIALSASECKNSNMQDDELTIVQQDYTGDKLKLDGFYYLKIKEDDKTIFNRYFFYRNGVVRYVGGTDDLNKKEFLSGNYKTQWGLFEIENERIKFELWYPSSGRSLPAYIREGTIMNDTTFHINKSYRMIDGERKELIERDELYHLYQYSPKPDSTTHYLN